MPKHLRVISVLVAGAVAVTLLAAAGCEKSVSVTTDGTTTTTTTTDGETVTTTTSEWWTTDTDQGDIPDEPIGGVINEQNVEITDVQVTDMDGYYDWTFSTGTPDEACGIILEDDAVHFSSRELATGTFEKLMDEEIEFDDYHSYYHYNQDDNTPMSVNVDWEAKVVVSEIDEDNDTVSGWARFDFSDGATRIEGSFTADLCEW